MSLEELRVVMAVALAVFLVVLRIDAQRLGAAEYDEPDEDGRRPPFLPRLAWYIAGVALVALIAVVHPDPARGLMLTLGSDRIVAIGAGIVLGLAGAGQAAGLALVRYGRLRLPTAREYPGAILNAIGTAFIDEAAFRGVILGLLIVFGVPALPAVVIQAIVYVLATRVGASRRPLYVVAFTLVLGLVMGWATLLTGGIGAAVIGHATTRLATFALTGHAAMVAPRGYEIEEIEEDRAPPPGWRVVGDDEVDRA